MEYLAHSELETEAAGEALGRSLSPGAVLAYLYSNYLNEKFDSQYEEEEGLEPVPVRVK